MKNNKAKLLEPIKENEIINIAHQIRLYPNNVQRTYLNKAMGCARLAYNWALTEWKRAYEAEEKPNAYSVRKSFNAIRREKFPFTYEVARSVTNQAILNLGSAFLNFFRGNADYPEYKKKSYTQGSFYLDNESLKFKDINEVTKKQIKGSYMLVPKLGYVRMAEKFRFNGKINSCVIYKRGEVYFASFSIEISKEDYNKTHKIKEPKNLTCGVDIGSIYAITLDNGYKVKPPKPLSKAMKKYARESRKLSRKQHKRSKEDSTRASKNYIKASRKLSKLALRISNVRKDFNHKQTSKVAVENKFIAVETLNVQGMMKNRKLSKSIQDVSYGDISSKLEYKAKYAGRYLYRADRFFPSSKRCCECKFHNKDLKLSDRTFICPSCGKVIDRDENSAINLREDMEAYLIGIAYSEFTLAERGSVDDRSPNYLRSNLSLKQESSVKSIKRR